MSLYLADFLISLVVALTAQIWPVTFACLMSLTRVWKSIGAHYAGTPLETYEAVRSSHPLFYPSHLLTVWPCLYLVFSPSLVQRPTHTCTHRAEEAQELLSVIWPLLGKPQQGCGRKLINSWTEALLVCVVQCDLNTHYAHPCLMRLFSLFHSFWSVTNLKLGYNKNCDVWVQHVSVCAVGVHLLALWAVTEVWRD